MDDHQGGREDVKDIDSAGKIMGLLSALREVASACVAGIVSAGDVLSGKQWSGKVWDNAL